MFVISFRAKLYSVHFFGNFILSNDPLIKFEKSYLALSTKGVFGRGFFGGREKIYSNILVV